MPDRDYEQLARLLSAERLGSYLSRSGGDLPGAFSLYEWNMAASAAVMHTTGMVEVVVRNFWRYLAAFRYLTALWTPALYRAFPAGPADKRQQQRQVEGHLKDLLLVRNRAAHHEPIHRRNLTRDLRASVEIASWVSPEAAAWVADLSTIADVVKRVPAS